MKTNKSEGQDGLSTRPNQQSMKMQPTPSLRSALVRGSLWMVAMRWTVRGIGLANTIILARLLTPADFGLMAMAMLLVSFLETFSAFGVDLALIRNQQADRRHFDTAWTIQIIQATSIALLIFVIAPFAADYYREPRVVSVLYVLALGTMTAGWKNIGVVAFRRDLDFGAEFKYLVVSKTISFLFTVVFAITFRSYWALALGILVGQISGVVLSYLFHPYRPRFDFSAARDIWGFSQWMLFVNIGSFIYDRADEIIVGGTTTTRDMGLYNVSYEISNLPTTELVFPISRALFPGFARLASESSRLRSAFLNVTGFIATVSIPAGLGLVLVADLLVAVLLGKQWTDAARLIQVLALFGTIRAIYGQAGSLLAAAGDVKKVVYLTWLQVIVLIPSGYIAGREFGIVGIAWAKVAVALLFGFCLMVAAAKALKFGWRDLAAILWRPLVAGGVMFVALSTAQRGIQSVLEDPFLNLLVNVFTGAVTYIVSLYILWLMVGRQSGPESYILEKIRERLPSTAKQ